MRFVFVKSSWGVALAGMLLPSEMLIHTSFLEVLPLERNTISEDSRMSMPMVKISLFMFFLRWTHE